LILSTAKSILSVATLLFVAPLAQADPKVDYLLHCSGCHMPDGSGLTDVVPNLHDTMGRIVAEPEGRTYIVRVPGASQAPISDEKLTEVLNWMLTEFSSDTLPENFKPLTVKEVKRARSRLLADPLKYRATLFPDY
jgi:mono/diheme cytochrome c family protein